MFRARRPAVVVALLAVTACSGDGGTTGTVTGTGTVAPSSSAPTDEVVESVAEPTVTTTTTTMAPVVPVRIGLVAPSGAGDASFTQSMAEALDRLAPPVDIEIVEDVSAADAGAALQRLADDGVDLVVAHGTEYESAVRETATAAPGVAFAWGPGEASIDLPNVFVYDARADQGGYVLGTMAATVSEAGMLGVVGSVEVADTRRYVEGFAAGAASSAAGAEVEITYIDSFDDPALAAEAARVIADRGADALTATSQMSVGVVAVAAERSLPFFANQVDQAPLAPDLVVASQVYRWEVAVDAILDALAAGDPGPGPFVLTLANGGLEVVYNDGFGLDPAIRAIGDDALAALLDGSVGTGVD